MFIFITCRFVVFHAFFYFTLIRIQGSHTWLSTRRVATTHPRPSLIGCVTSHTTPRINPLFIRNIPTRVPSSSPSRRWGASLPQWEHLKKLFDCYNTPPPLHRFAKTGSTDQNQSGVTLREYGVTVKVHYRTVNASVHTFAMIWQLVVMISTP